MKKISEMAFVAGIAFVSGYMYEQGRKQGKGDKRLAPDNWGAAVGGRVIRDRITEIIKEAQKRAEQAGNKPLADQIADFLKNRTDTPAK